MHDKPGNVRGALGPQEFRSYKDAWELMQRHAQTVEWQVERWVRDTLEEMEWPHRPR